MEDCAWRREIDELMESTSEIAKLKMKLSFIVSILC